MKSVPLLLASTSSTRKRILKDCGLDVTVTAPHLDEPALQRAWSHLPPSTLATALAGAKAEEVSRRHPGVLVIGADQTLSLQGVVQHKAGSLDQAKSNLQNLCGNTHQLHSAVVCVKDGAVLFEHVSNATMTMRAFSEDFLNDYLARTPQQALHSIGGYHYEASGIQLFAAVEGDYHTILGLPLLPLLAFLRQSAMIPQ